MTFIDLSALSRTHGGSQPLRAYLARPVGATHVGPDPQAAADAWRRIEAFFRAQLG
jgi:dienelactone hydrolase